MREPFNEHDVRTYGAEDSPFARHPSPVTRHLKFYKGGGAPTPESYYSQISGELKAKSELAPTVYATEAQFDPQYAALNNQTLNTTLFGSPGGTQTYATPGYSTAMSDYNNSLAAYYDSPRRGGAGAAGISGASNWGGRGGRDGNLSPNFLTPMAAGLSPTTTVNMPASRGIIGMANDIGTSQRNANISDWSNMSPAALAAIKASNPQLASILDLMMSQSQGELNMGGNLNPAMMRQMQQTIRSRQQGMLGGTGNAGDYGEAMAMGQFGQGLRQQRFQNAGTAAGISGDYYTSQMNDLMDRTYNPYGGLAAGQSGGIGPKLFGSDINAGQVNSQNYQAALSNYNAQQNNSAGLQSAGISGAATIGGIAILAF